MCEAVFVTNRPNNRLHFKPMNHNPICYYLPTLQKPQSLYLSKYPSFEFIGLLLIQCSMCHTTKNHIYGFSNRKINTETKMANLLNETKVHVKNPIQLFNTIPIKQPAAISSYYEFCNHQTSFQTNFNNSFSII